MATFPIDTENNIAAHTAVPANLENARAFESEKQLAKLAAEWPGSRLTDIWTSFAGVAPFSDLKPVKKFTDANRPSRGSGRRSSAFRPTVRHRRATWRRPRTSRRSPRASPPRAPGRNRAQRLPKSAATRERKS